MLGLPASTNRNPMRIDSARIRGNVGVGRGHGHPTLSLDSARLAEPSGQAGRVGRWQVWTTTVLVRPI